MTFETLDTYIRTLPNTTFDYPFDEEVRVYRIGNKMFALTADKAPLSVNLKCDPIYALELRTLYEGITPGFHMNKKHWNTIDLSEKTDVDEETIRELIDHSSERVFGSLTKKLQRELGQSQHPIRSK
jgi:predicted DNA-binding protein (MmcQ/YjbR family)